MTSCIFCEIIAGKTNTDFVYQDDQIVVFSDIKPKANTHLLVVPKQHIKSLAEIDETHAELITHITTMLPKIAKTQGLGQGFRTIINTGRGGGQIVDHLHYHLLGGDLLPVF